VIRAFVLALAAAAFLPAHAADPPPDPMALLAQQTSEFHFTAEELEGPGADILDRLAAQSQFVLLGEEHMDHSIPVFAGALFRLLHDRHGYRHLVVEQDPVAIEDALDPVRRGDAEKLGAHAKRYPSLFEFDTDEDLELLALVSRLVKGPDAIWGVEQTTGAVRYLEELARLAPDADSRKALEKVLAQARAADAGPRYSVNWLIAENTQATLASLDGEIRARSGTRAYRLFHGLSKSSEIFGYYRRAEAGEWVGLFNNTVREEVLKANFIERYRAAAKREASPKAMLKFGANHLYHGKNPTQAFPIGNLAHELAVFNGRHAVGIYVMPLGPNYMSYADFPKWMLPLLPAKEPVVPTLINLRPLRPYQRLFREKAEVGDQWMVRDLINGYDAIVLIPGSKPGSRNLGGR
jgi:hypothetical protein